MKRQLLTAPLFFLLAPTAFAMTAQQEQQIVDNVLAVTGQVPLVLPDTIPVHRLCGTATLMEAKLRFNELSPQAQATLRPFLYPRPVLQTSYDPPSGRFRIHYDTSGTGAVRNAGIDANLNGVPDWVDTVGFILDSIWNKEVVQLGFRAPVADGFYPAGGDDRFDVYLDELGSSFLGYTAPDSAGGILGNQATAFIVLDNDYAGIPGYTDPDGPRRAIRVTAAHEFFHAIQFAYTAFGAEVVGGEVKPYWYEATATWMEDQVYNEINDYIQYLPFWFNRPELSFRSFSYDFANDPYRVFRPYAMSIYGHYLSKRFPNPSYEYAVVRRIWERMATVMGFNLFSAIDYALGTEGSNFIASLQEFYRWNYFVGSKGPLNVPDTLYGSEAAIWPSFETYRTFDSTYLYPTRSQDFPCTNCSESQLAFFHSAPCTRDLGPPCIINCSLSVFVPYTRGGVCIQDIEDLGASYLKLKNSGSEMDIAFSMLADTERSAPWNISAIGYQSGTRTYSFIDSASTNSSRVDSLILPNFGNYSEIIVAVINNELLPSGASRQNSAYAYAADTTVVPTTVGDEPGHRPKFFTLYQNRPNPFNSATVISFYFPASIDATLEIFNIAGQSVRILWDGKLGAGEHSMEWDGRDKAGRPVSSGIYLFRLETAGFSEIKRMVLLK